MGITANISLAEVQGRIEAFTQELEALQLEALEELGEMCVSRARSIPFDTGFEDQTGNLRSSIGYGIYRNGEKIFTSYEVVGTGSSGAEIGEELAQRVAQEQEGLVLVVTAGMRYSVYLEAMGRDVLTSARHLAESTWPRMLEELIRNVKDSME